MIPIGSCGEAVLEDLGRYSGESWISSDEDERKAPRWMEVGAKSYAGSSWDSSAMDGQRTRWRMGVVCCAVMVFISIAEAIADTLLGCS